jgi:hypothetical protein
MAIPGLSSPYVDFLLLADFAEVVNGKLYLMGGAWDSYTLADPARPARFAIAVAVMVPWACTNEKHTLRVRIDNADGQTVTPEFPIDFQVGRPPTLAPGTEQRLVWAINGDFALRDAGAYSLVAAIDGQDSRRTAFVVLVPQATATESQP